MRAISLTQPWAQAIRDGKKKWETRSWSTAYRGEIAIHAAKGFPLWAKEFAEEESYVAWGVLPLGKIVCVCELVDCQPTSKLRRQLSDLELKWGDYTDGRFAFRLENVKVLPSPIPATGALQIWTTSATLQDAILEQLKSM